MTSGIAVMRKMINFKDAGAALARRGLPLLVGLEDLGSRASVP